MNSYKKTIILTGASGGIGSSLVKALLKKKYSVIGVDLIELKIPHQNFTQVKIDLHKYVYDDSYQILMNKNLIDLPAIDGRLFAIINMAAIQKNKALLECDTEDWLESSAINYMAPFLLGKFFHKQLSDNSGFIINVTSIHEDLTKDRFGLYSVTKSAMSALTRAMAIEWGKKIKVVSVSPAAIKTDMLLAGFNDNLDKVQELEKIHPSGNIGEPNDVVEIILNILNFKSQFINGANIAIDGGVRYKLCDID